MKCCFPDYESLISLPHAPTESYHRAGLSLKFDLCELGLLYVRHFINVSSLRKIQGEEEHSVSAEWQTVFP